MIDIAAIRKDIEDIGEDARLLAFMVLYSSQEPAAKSEIDRIIRLRDPVVKLMFLRFLGSIKEERAVRYICRMLEDDNSVVTGASKRSFERSRFEKKMEVLRDLLDSPHRSALLFAIDQLSQAGQVRILDRLMVMIAGADDGLLEAILMAMRFVPSRKGVETLLSFATDSRPRIRFRVALAGVSYIQAGIHRMHSPLLNFLEDPDPSVRLAAVWGVGQLLQQRDADRLMQVSIHDPDAELRQAAIMVLGRFPAPNLVTHLLTVMVNDPDQWVAMRCESILLNLPAALLQKGLDKVLVGGAARLRNRAILLSAEIQRGSADYFAQLRDGLEKAQVDKDRIPYLEALGIYNDPRAVLVLLKYVRMSPVVGYVAMGSLIKVVPTEEPLVAYLEDSLGSPILKQMILRHFSRLEKINPAFHDRMIRILGEFLKSDTINIRYLGVQVLVRLSGLSTQDTILETLQRETDPAASGLMRSTLICFFADPSVFLSTLLRHRGHDRAFVILQDIMGEVVWSELDISNYIPKLLDDTIVRGDNTYITNCTKWIARQLFLGRVGLKPVIQGLEGLGCLEQVLVQLVDELRLHPQLRLSVTGDVLSGRIKAGSDGMRRALIELMGISLDPTAVPALVDVICDDSLGPLHAVARQSLMHIVGDEA